MQPHEARVIAEKAELDARLDKLRAFLETDRAAMLDEYDRNLLENQVQWMAGYSAILAARIDRFVEAPLINSA